MSVRQRELARVCVMFKDHRRTLEAVNIQQPVTWQLIGRRFLPDFLSIRIRHIKGWNCSEA